MLVQLKQSDSLSDLQQQLRRTETITCDLMSSVLAHTCRRSASQHSSEKANRVRKLIAAEAWTDAALALIDLELPQWKLRRLVHDDGVWSCTLGKQPQLPDWLDDTVEASHGVAALAILCALVEARGAGSISSEARTPTVPQVRPKLDCALCCDNFA